MTRRGINIGHRAPYLRRTTVGIARAVSAQAILVSIPMVPQQILMDMDAPSTMATKATVVNLTTPISLPWRCAVHVAVDRLERVLVRLSHIALSFPYHTLLTMFVSIICQAITRIIMWAKVCVGSGTVRILAKAILTL